jgi:hypothetical protein
MGVRQSFYKAILSDLTDEIKVFSESKLKEIQMDE